MVTEDRSQYLADSLQHVYRHWESRHQAATGQSIPSPPSHPAFTIAISRQAGTQGTLISKEIGKRLSWPVYDHELLELVAQEMGVRVRLLESLDEKRGSWLLEAFEQFMEVPEVGSTAYVHNLIKTLLALGLHGECVIVGRGACHVLPITTTLRVRLMGPVKDRILAFSKRLGISRKDAEERVEAPDHH